MELNHKIFQLVNPKGESVVLEDINNLRILVEGVDFDIPLMPQKEGDPVFCKLVEVNDSCFHGFCLFEKFQHKAPGYLTHDDIHISFFDTVLNTELLVKEIAEPGWFNTAVGKGDIPDEEVSLLLKTLKKCANKAIEMAEKEVKVEPAVVQPDALPEPEVTAEEPVTEQPKAEEAVTEEPKTEEPKTEEPVVIEGVTDTVTTEVPKVEDTEQQPVITEPVVETVPAVENQTATQLEENVIPSAVMAKYETNKKYLVEEEGYAEFSYKNYRFYVKPDDVEDCLLLLLTTESLAKVTSFDLEEQDKQGVYKYSFELAGEEKYLYYTVAGEGTEGSIVVKKPKKKK